MHQVSQIRSRNKKSQKRSFGQLAEALAVTDTIIPSIEEEGADVNNDQFNMDDGYGDDEEAAGEDVGGAQDDGNDQQPQATTAAIVLAPTTRPHRSISKKL